MINAFEFSNWNQLSGLRSYYYKDLVIHVTQFNSVELVGTKIDIVDEANTIIYFSGFVRVVKSSRFDELAVYDVDDIIKRINAYGFNIAIIEPLRLPPNVIDMLKGFKALGYNYLTLQYIHEVNTSEMSIFQADIDVPEYDYDDYTEHYLPPPYKAFNNKMVFATKGFGETVNIWRMTYTQPQNIGAYIVSDAPEFSWEDFKWMKPTKIYSIELLLNPKGDSKTPISDAEVDEKPEGD